MVNWNGKEETLERLESLRWLTYGNYTVCVADNGSKDGSREATRLRCPETHVIETGESLEFGGGSKIGMKWALDHGAQAVLLLNNDTVVAPDLLERSMPAAFFAHGRPGQARAVLGSVADYCTGRFGKAPI